VAIGNDRVDTVDDPNAEPAALIGMDLVRLGLERGRDAADAVEQITGLLELHGQGGVASNVKGEAYWSSFLVTDSTSAWVLETSGRSWAARPERDAVAISNRLTLGSDWVRASPDPV
jgi:dipeptidase